MVDTRMGIQRVNILATTKWSNRLISPTDLRVEDKYISSKQVI